MSQLLFDNDYSSDTLRWIKLIEENNLQLYPYRKVPQDLNSIKAIQEKIIKDNDYPLAYFFASEFQFEQYKMQKVILSSKDPKYAFLFAQNIYNCDILALENIVLNSNKLKYICNFACLTNISQNGFTKSYDHEEHFPIRVGVRITATTK